MFLGIIFRQRHDARTQNARKLSFPLENTLKSQQGTLTLPPFRALYKTTIGNSLQMEKNPLKPRKNIFQKLTTPCFQGLFFASDSMRVPRTHENHVFLSQNVLKGPQGWVGFAFTSYSIQNYYRKSARNGNMKKSFNRSKNYFFRKY